jgi:hypothetical protein
MKDLASLRNSSYRIRASSFLLLVFKIMSGFSSILQRQSFEKLQYNLHTTKITVLRYQAW